MAERGTKHDHYDKGIEDLLPNNTWPILARWLSPYSCNVLLHRPRKSKLGDFRPARMHRPTSITLNQDLSPYQMLLTLTHEIAHLINWSTHGPKVAAHGPEWKACFGQLLRELATVTTLPESYRTALVSHAKNPKSSVTSDPQLYRLLRDLEGKDERTLVDVKQGQTFVFRGRVFKKVSSQRSRCLCKESKTGRMYHIPKLAAVTQD